MTALSLGNLSKHPSSSVLSSRPLWVKVKCAPSFMLQANRQQILKWLNTHSIDPNDPRNAPLLELMRANEATSGGMSDLFRLDVFPDVAIEEDRAQVRAQAEGTKVGVDARGS